MAQWMVNRKETYDQASGQMFTETTVPGDMVADASTKMGAAWAHESPFFPKCARPSWGRRGVISLKELAMYQALSDQRLLTSEHFQEFPSPLAREMLEFLKDYGSLTLHMWKIFATVYDSVLNNENRLYKFKASPKKMPMHKYLNLVESDSLCWRTSIWVSTEGLQLTELVEICSVSNLTWFRVTSPLSGKRRQTDDQGREIPNISVTDRVIKTWSEAAAAGRAFIHLRSLILENQDELTCHIFPYLDSFPALTMFVLSGCMELDEINVSKVAAQHGWECVCEPSGDLTAYQYSKSIRSLRRDTSDSAPSPLVLELKLGEMRYYAYSSQSPVLYTFKKCPVTASQARSRPIDEHTTPTMPRGSKPPKLKASKRMDIAGLLADFS